MSSERVAAVASRVEKLAANIAEPSAAPAPLTREIVVRAVSSEDTARPAPEPQAPAAPVEAGPTGAASATPIARGGARVMRDEIIRWGS